MAISESWEMGKIHSSQRRTTESLQFGKQNRNFESGSQGPICKEGKKKFTNRPGIEAHNEVTNADREVCIIFTPGRIVSPCLREEHPLEVGNMQEIR